MIVISVIYQIFSTLSHSTRTHVGVTFSGLILSLDIFDANQSVQTSSYKMSMFWGLMYCIMMIINDATLHTF